MKSSFALLCLASLAVAVPLEQQTEAAAYHPCSGLQSTLLCCSAGLLDLAFTNCDVPDSDPEDADDLKSICAEEGAQAKCCTLNLESFGLVCHSPPGAKL